MSAACLEVDWLTPSQIAQRLGTHSGTVIRWIARGTTLLDGSRLKLGATRTPGQWRVDPAALDAFLERLTADRSNRAGQSDPTPKPIKTARAQKLNAELAAAGLI